MSDREKEGREAGWRSSLGSGAVYNNINTLLYANLHKSPQYFNLFTGVPLVGFRS